MMISIIYNIYPVTFERYVVESCGLMFWAPLDNPLGKYTFSFKILNFGAQQFYLSKLKPK